MKRQIKIVVKETEHLEEKVIEFFAHFNFRLLESEGDSLRFGKRSTLLDAWKTNPLTWGSEIVVSFSANNVLADVYVDTDAQMNTIEEKAVWEKFIENFENYLSNGVVDKSILNSTISESKKSRLIYLGWALLGALTGGFLSFLYTNLTNNYSTLSTLLIPIMATTFLAWKIKYAKIKNAL